MTGLAFQCSRVIPATGVLVFRGPDGAVPKGYRAFGPLWAMVLPGHLQAAELKSIPAGFVVTKPDAVTDLQDQVDAFWQETIAGLLPVPIPQVPWSDAGVADGAALGVSATNEAARGRQIADHLKARAVSRTATHALPSFADLAIRQIAILHLPSSAEATLLRGETGDWVLEFRESGSLGHLFGVISWVEPKDKGLECRAPTGAAEGPLGVLAALARAVQLAQLVVASGLDAQDGLRVEVSHAGLFGKKVVLTLRPEDRGLALARLAQWVAEKLRSRKGFQDRLEGLPCRPALVADSESIPEVGEPNLDQPLRWYRQDDAAVARWTYCGDRATSSHYPAGIPFALAPRDGAVEVMRSPSPAFHDLPSQARAAYAAWLAGTRGADGFHPDFANLYLQGMEYRILSDAAPKEEAAALLTEIQRVRTLLDQADPLIGRIDTLSDWLCAIGKGPAGPLALQGPLTRLVTLGKAVAEGRALVKADLLGLMEVTGDLISPDALLLGVPADWPDELMLTPSSKPLVARYVSLCGLCDVERHVFRLEGGPVPDLRASARLCALLSSGGSTAAEGR
ncbi:MAG: TerB N-terminal domain-containing protein [Gemmobacter sp.]|nr:TerB N-terminal domain-containing protein [Gemmobacter sp.]